MCIICVSKPGIAQPTLDQMRNMFNANSHGAGYMVARNGRVEASKGFMTWDDFIRAVKYEKFTDADAVVYHFRISTQAGVNPQMTHPFPLTGILEKTKLIDFHCPIGVVHNGIIQLTTNHRDREYSDTAHYIAEFLRYLVRTPGDLRNAKILDAIERTTHSKWALMDGTGYIATVGDFIEDGGLLFSNTSYRASRFKLSAPSRAYRWDDDSRSQVIRGFFEDEPETDADEDDGEPCDSDYTPEELREIYGDIFE